jgi:hypothetical protein
MFSIVCGAFPMVAMAAAKSINDNPTQQSQGLLGNDNKPVLTVTPREIDLGAIRPGETVFGEFSLRNLVKQNIEWSASCPEDWETTGGKALKGMVSDQQIPLNLELNIADRVDIPAGDKNKASSYRVTMKMESAGKEFVCYRDLKAGNYRINFRISSPGGQRTVHLGFRIRALQESPTIHLNPQRLDLGVQIAGKSISRRIELTNRGREMLRWSVASAGSRHAAKSSDLPKERYISFRNEQNSEPGKYVIPDRLKDSIELIGKWTEKNGYPVFKGSAGAFKFRFSGTGLSVFLQSHTEEGICQIYLDETPLTLPDVLSGEWEKKELVIAERLPDGPHVVSIVVREGMLELEGVKVFGKDITRGPKGWITVYPNSGTTMSETDYINVKVDTSNLEPGYYGDEIVFRSNAGEESVEIFVDVIAETAPKVIDVYLYSQDMDYLFTSDPQAEFKRLIQNGYLKEGIAFRLFVPNTPGTTSFYRWYNPSLHDHFYHYDRSGGGKDLKGYVYEGIIGNIATSKMSNTRELYRWFNPKTKKYYYSTDPKAATGIRKGYKFDGIAGYVR